MKQRHLSQVKVIILTMKLFLIDRIGFSIIIDRVINAFQITNANSDFYINKLRNEIGKNQTFKGFYGKKFLFKLNSLNLMFSRCNI